MKHEYREGPKARKRFDEGMKKLFRAPKTVNALKPPPKRKRLRPAMIRICAFRVLAAYKCDVAAPKFSISLV
jgi:hypothetical protein